MQWTLLCFVYDVTVTSRSERGQICFKSNLTFWTEQLVKTGLHVIFSVYVLNQINKNENILTLFKINTQRSDTIFIME